MLRQGRVAFGQEMMGGRSCVQALGGGQSIIKRQEYSKMKLGVNWGEGETNYLGP